MMSYKHASNPFLLQALPIFLSKLLSPVLAVVLSVTAVLLVGKEKQALAHLCCLLRAQHLSANPCQLRAAAMHSNALWLSSAQINPECPLALPWVIALCGLHFIGMDVLLQVKSSLRLCANHMPCSSATTVPGWCVCCATLLASYPGPSAKYLIMSWAMNTR